MSNEKRVERVMRLAKLGKRVDTVTPIKVRGRPIYGTWPYRKRYGGNKAIIAVRESGELYFQVLMEREGNDNPANIGWRPIHPRLAAILELIFMGQI